MRFLKHLIKINDVYFISEQLKTINKNFELFYNKNTNRFEVHNTKSARSFIVSFDKYPNPNLIYKTLKSMNSDIEEISKEIENHNTKIQEKNNLEILQTASDNFREILNFSEKTNKELSQKQIKKIIEKG